MTDPLTFRAQFPCFEHVVHLNAGSNGPVPAAGAAAAAERIDRECREGRTAGPDYVAEFLALGAGLRDRYARLLGCDATEVSLTRCTTDGVNAVLAGCPLGRGDEVLTSDEEHPGLLGPLGSWQRRRGFRVRVAPFAELAGAITSETRVVACSHVSWVSGQVADTSALAASGVPVLLDGAQALGAIPVDVAALGCSWYAASGQKWLCGPDGTGCLYVSRDRLAETEASWMTYAALNDPYRALESGPRADAGRFDMGFLPAAQAAWAAAAFDLLEAAGWSWLADRAVGLAQRLADLLVERGSAVSPRGRSTLVAWRTDDPAATVARLAEHGIAVRSVPGHGTVRASVGAWNSDDDLERLVALVN